MWLNNIYFKMHTKKNKKEEEKEKQVKKNLLYFPYLSVYSLEKNLTELYGFFFFFLINVKRFLPAVLEAGETSYIVAVLFN